MIRSFQWDLARQVERLDWLIAQLPRYADWGYQEVHLHLEDAIEYPSLPGVARADAYSYPQVEQLVAAATRSGIKVVPIVNLLGHTQYLIKVPELRDLNELRAPDGSALERGQICPLHPRTMEIAERLLRDVAPLCTAGKVHVGLDESFHLGRHPLSQHEIGAVGLAGHFSRYVGRLHALTSSLNLHLAMWADMLYFLPEAIPQLPAGITAYEWYYHRFTRHPRVELFNFAEVDLTTPLQTHGIALYGCAMNGAFRYEPLPHFTDRLANLQSWWRHGSQIGAAGFLVSSWESNRLAAELPLLVDASAATLWLEPSVTDPHEMLSRGIERVSDGRSRRRPDRRCRQLGAVLLAADEWPYSGYPRWEINDRWDTISRREPLAQYRREASVLSALTTEAERASAPPAMQASLDFRAALSLRELLLRQLARRSDERRDKAVRRYARLLRSVLVMAQNAARRMWIRTRDPAVVGPNEAMLRRDLQRLAGWQRGEPAFGPAWQLCYRVWNFAPAVQLVGVEQQQPDGTWRTLQSCHTIEFQSCAAQPRGRIVREHAAPVEWDGTPGTRPRLRVFVRGVGQVKIGGIALVGPGGVTIPPHALRDRWTLLGQAARKAGWPAFATSDEGAWLELSWEPQKEAVRPPDPSAISSPAPAALSS